MRLYRTIRCTFNASPEAWHQLLRSFFAECGMLIRHYPSPHTRSFMERDAHSCLTNYGTFPRSLFTAQKISKQLRSIMLFVPRRDRKLTASSHSSIPCRSPTLRTRTVSQPSTIPKPSLASRPTAKLSRGSSTGLLGPRLKSERLMASREGL